MHCYNWRHSKRKYLTRNSTGFILQREIVKIHPAPTKCCQLHIHHFFGFLRLSSSSTLSKIDLGNSRVLGRPLTTVAGKVFRVKSKNNLVPAIQSRQHSTNWMERRKVVLLWEALVPPPCIRANSQGAPNLDHSLRVYNSPYLALIYLTHSFSFFFSFAFDKLAWDRKGAQRWWEVTNGSKGSITLLVPHC